ncbi:hypothetical protein NECID01_0480 [Nematocida sp. AWRm77]|nr:hypothetical protein NECID01_0480 [Nematocida sp. AWRm77]
MDILIGSTGREIEILTTTQVRYSGTLKACDPEKGTINLMKVISHGTERRGSYIRIPGSSQIYEFIVFKVSKIEKIKTDKKWKAVSPSASLPLSPPAPSTLPAEKRERKERERGEEKERYAEKGSERDRDTERERERDKGHMLEMQCKLPSTKYDFQKNNERLARSKEPKKGAVQPYNPEFFYDTFS